MLSITVNTSDNLVEAKITNKLQKKDFSELAAHIDALIAQHGNINILLNASEFNGWENIKAAEEHFRFVKKHHKNIERIAVITKITWQHWLIALARVFVHPEIKIFGDNQLKEAKAWIKTNTNKPRA